MNVQVSRPLETSQRQPCQEPWSQGGFDLCTCCLEQVRFAEGFVAGHDQGRPFVAGGDQLEEQVALLP